MDIINHYSAYTTARTSAVSQAETTTPKVGFMSENEFLDMVKEQSGKSVDDSSRLYNGSTTRAKLSDTEIAVLANKYDVRNMSDEEFDAFLDDLENMGALSDYEKHQLGYRGSVTVGYVRDGKLEGSGVSGMWAAPEVPGGSTKLFNRQDANGDIFRWINDRIQWKRSYSSDPIQRKTEEDYEDLHSTLAGIVGRMAVCHTDTAETRNAEPQKEAWTVTESDFLYNGSTTRAKLSDTEIAVLANKYDVRNMSDEEYDNFLDDLESMGAISRYEKLQELGYKGIGILDLKMTGDVEDGVHVMSAWSAPFDSEGRAPFFHQWQANGNIFKWLTDRSQYEPTYQYKDPYQRKVQKDREELYDDLAGIVGRMAVRRTDDEEAQRKAELVRQLADGNSDFYTRMRTMLKAQVEKTREDEEEQAIIDALGKVLDALSGKKDVTGKKVSLNTSANELTKAIGDRIAELKQKDPNDPEIAKLENMLKQLQNAGLYINMGMLDGLWQGEDDTFETLTQLLTRRQAEEISAHPNQKEVNEPA